MSSSVPTPADPVPDADRRIETRTAGLTSQPRSRRWLRALLLLVGLAGLMTVAASLWQVRQAQKEWRLVEAALQRHDLVSAASHLDRYLGRRPQDSRGWFLAGRTARRLSRYSEAEQYLARCQQLGGVTAETRLEWDLLRVHQGNLGDVHTRLRMTIPPDHPDAPLVLEALAQGYLKCDRLRDVMEACDLWISRQPEHPWPWFWRGGVYERLGNFHEALADYQRALERTPEDREIRLALAALFARARQANAAVEHYEQILEQAPTDEEALLGLAACRIEQGRFADAIGLLDRVTTSESLTARGLFLRGKAALGQQDASTAERWLTGAVQKAPDDAEALHQLILALRAQDKHAAADRLGPRLETLRRDLARLNELIKTVARTPADVHPRHEAGVVALRIGRSDDGVRWLLSALRVRGDHRATHAALAEHFRRQGDARAEYHRQQAQLP